MEKRYTLVDTDRWVRRTTYQWFRTFRNPTYRFGVKIDVGDVLAYSHETHTSFFVNFLYAVSKALNRVEALRLRYVDGEVRLYERVDPTFTVKTTDGSFNNATCRYLDDYPSFYEGAASEVKRRSGTTDNSGEYNGQDYGVFYGSCITSIALEEYCEALNEDDPDSLNVPHVFWDKYREENGKTVLLLNVTVSHVLVDGEQLSQAFGLIQDYCSAFRQAIAD